ncbi:MAG: ATP synthase F1 subunit gamma [Deferribacteres bacterium]|nr:ATP synthase F1 subunit gamma [candidate division KSB1 bacterium]MCB9502983.1 ATP synthase F1 subunit gamma [Deferribacteres bacterium]
MATLRDIRRRITSVAKTQQITKAMKMVAAAKLRRAQERVDQARPYAQGVSDVLARVAANVDVELNPFFQKRDRVKHITYIIVSADRGFCGGFNSNVFKETQRLVARDRDEGLEVNIIAVGKKGADYFKRRNFPVTKAYRDIFKTLKFEDALEISKMVQGNFLDAGTDAVKVIYSSAKSAIRTEIHVNQCLPIVQAETERHKNEGEYLFEPGPVEMLDHLCPSAVNIQIWQAMLESYAAEESARMVAMESATDAAQDMIDSLTLHYNKARQAAITSEISEIVGGAEALK